MKSKRKPTKSHSSISSPHDYLETVRPRKSDLKLGADRYIAKSIMFEEDEYDKIERANKENQEHSRKILELNLRLNLLSEQYNLLSALFKRHIF